MIESDPYTVVVNVDFVRWTLVWWGRGVMNYDPYIVGYIHDCRYCSVIYSITFNSRWDVRVIIHYTPFPPHTVPITLKCTGHNSLHPFPSHERSPPLKCTGHNSLHPFLTPPTFPFIYKRSSLRPSRNMLCTIAYEQSYCNIPIPSSPYNATFSQPLAFLIIIGYLLFKHSNIA